MKEIGVLLKVEREKMDVSLEEVSDDIKINTMDLDKIEEGDISYFEDLIQLKDLLIIYSKYLSLNSNKIIDMYNSFLYDYTSRIPKGEIKEVNHAIKVEEKRESANKIASPYTMGKHKQIYVSNTLVIVIIVVVCIIIGLIYLFLKNL